MISPSPARPIPMVIARLAVVILLGLLAIGCANRPPYKKVAGLDPKLETPPHNMSAYDYPFDDDGTYRKDWVTNKNAKRPKTRKSSTTNKVAANTPPAPRPAPTPTVASRPPAPRPAPTQSHTPPPASRPAPTPAPAAKPAPKPRYHTVAKGDTLYSLSRRYGASVGRIKSTNGLSSDTIRIGQTLRMP